MHDHASRLVDDDQLIILVDHGKRDVLCRDMALARVRHVDLDQVACCHARLGLNDHRAVDPHSPSIEQPHQPGARQRRHLWHIADKRFIKARRRIFPDPE